MKRYLVFAGSKFYPAGGWEDFKRAFWTLEEAQGWCRGYCDSDTYHWAHVVCEHEIVFKLDPAE